MKSALLLKHKYRKDLESGLTYLLFLAASSCPGCSAHDAHLFPFYSPLKYGTILSDVAIARDAPAHTWRARR